MQEALGLRPVTQRRGGCALDAQEMKELLKRGEGVDGGGAEEEATRVNGLGYSKLGADAGPARKAGEEFTSGGAHPGLQPVPQAATAAAPPQRSRRHDSSSSSSDSDGGERRAERRARKAERAERRAERRARKEERHHHSRKRSRSRERR